ncbi:hypothetical protein T265_15339 [Opisthorchis viverrini]|uniref:Kinesin motor domain-containing protein n=1 Tax=Opisthorchis viverrini TaxID=6198 RepID=A0A074ZAT5_OPIVI|nr:hypothetical protein T265_15339 [Opisthorchis viverrini]KER20350.1 hypothetical protein T265_15339 [Opisthorchis viverrini]
MLDPDAGQTITEALSKASKAVQQLISFRNQFLGQVVDAYQLLSPDENGRVWQDLKRVEALVSDIQQLLTNKSIAMKNKFDETVSLLRSVEPMFARASLTEKAQFCYLNGKALNAIQPDLLETTDESIDLAGQASQWLKRALKYNPQLVDAWCELGESSWRLGDPGEASNHFRQALKIEPDHVEAMCQLSMVLRQLPRSPEKPDEASARKLTQESDPFAESVHLAHAAVGHQPTNGHAWSILGNALLSSYFNKFASIAPPPFTDSPTTNGDVKPDESGPAGFTSSQLIMTRCIAAYAQAAKDRETALEPNFHFNRGFTWHSQDMFALCLRSWLTAICLDPQWSAPRIKALRLTHFLLELDRCLHQIKQELCEIAVEQEAGGENVQPDRLKKSLQRSKRDPYHVRELVAPLAPCLSLVADSENDIEPEKKIAQRRALTRFLGPYCPSAAGDPDAASILSGITVKMKKSKRVKSKQPSMISPSPFSPGTNSWKLKFALFEDLQIGTNHGKVCVGRVVTQLPSDTDAALNLLLVDAKGSPLPVRLCNIGKGLGPVRKDILAIPHPFIEQSPVQGHLLRAVLLLQAKFGSGTDELTTKLLSKLQLASTDHTDEITNETTADTIPPIPDITYSFLRVPLPDVLVVNGQPVVRQRKPTLATHKQLNDVPTGDCQLQYSPRLPEDCKQAILEQNRRKSQMRKQNSNAHNEPSVDIELDYSVYTCISNPDDTEINTISEVRTLNISEQDVTVDSSSDSTSKHPVPTVLQEAKRNSLGFAFGQKLLNMFQTTRISCRNHPEASKKILNLQKPAGTSESAIQRFDGPHSKGDRVATPVGHLRPWPPAMQFQQQNPRTDSQEDPVDLTVSTQILLKQHNANLLQSLKDATVQLARKDMEMQRLISVNSQLGERYSRMRGQYLELAREQARLRQRYDMLLVRGLDREQLHESNTNLEGQMEQLRTQLAESEERANQLNRRLVRVELEAKETAQSAATAEARLSQLQAELERKDVQLRAQTCRKFMEAARELQARAILNELLELKGNIRVMIRKARSRRQATAAALNTPTTYLHFVLILRVRGLCSGALIGKENKTRTEIKEPRPISPASPVSHELYLPEELDSRLRLGNNEEPGSTGLTTRMATHGLLVLADLAGFDGLDTGQNRSNPLSTNRQSRQPLMTIANKEQERRSKTTHNNCAAFADSEVNETKQLGKSLITLGRVFDAMVGGDGSGKHHIPYRDSKLTHLLKPALCGDARCMLIVTLNTHESCFEASMRSLKLAARASKISTGRVKRNAAICGGIRTTSLI